MESLASTSAVIRPSEDMLAPLPAAPVAVSAVPVESVVRQLRAEGADLVRSPTSQIFLAGVARVVLALFLARRPWSASLLRFF